MAFVTARNALATNTAESIAQLTAGEYVHFHNVKDLKAGLVKMSSDVPNERCAELSSNVADSGIALAASRTQGSSAPGAEVEKRILDR